MESRKTVLMNPFAGQQWRRRHRKQTCRHGREGESETSGERSMETYTVPHANRQPVGICSMTQEAQTQRSMTT